MAQEEIRIALIGCGRRAPSWVDTIRAVPLDVPYCRPGPHRRKGETPS